MESARCNHLVLKWFVPRHLQWADWRIIRISRAFIWSEKSRLVEKRIFQSHQGALIMEWCPCLDEKGIPKAKETSLPLWDTNLLMCPTREPSGTSTRGIPYLRSRLRGASKSRCSEAPGESPKRFTSFWGEIGGTHFETSCPANQPKDNIEKVSPKRDNRLSQYSVGRPLVFASRKTELGDIKTQSQKQLSLLRI